MTIFREIDSNTRINGSLKVSLPSTFLDNLSVSGLLSAGDIEDINTAIKAKIGSAGGTINGDLTVGGTLSATKIEGIDLSNYYTKEQLQIKEQSSIHWDNITDKNNVAQLDSPNVFSYEGTAIKIRPVDNLSTQHETEAVVFNVNTKSLLNKPVDSLSEIVKKGSTTYQRGLDYSIDYYTGQITRLTDGNIPVSDAVTVSYESTKSVFEIVNPSNTDTYFSIDNKGNIHGKSISVMLTSSSESSESTTEGNFSVEGNIVIKGNSILGNDNDDNTVVTGSLNVYDENHSSLFSVSNSGSIDLLRSLSIGGLRKDVNWDTAYNHISDNEPHISIQQRQEYNSAYAHSESSHAPTDAPSNSVFEGHTRDLDKHIKENERDNWDSAYAHISSDHLKLGESSTDAYYGDKGKEAYDHSLSNHAPINAQKNSDITKKEIESKLVGEINSHIHDTLNSKDTQNIEEEPQDISKGLHADFKKNITNNLSNSGANNGVLTYRPHGTNDDFSGSPVHQLSFTYNGDIYRRRSLSKDSWSPWYRLWDDRSFKSSDYLPLTAEKTLTGKLTIGTPTHNKNLTINGTIEAKNISISNTNVISGFNADMVNSFKAKDMFNATAILSGNGVVHGCKVEGLSSSFKCKMSAGEVFVKDYGLKSVSRIDSFGDFTRNEYNLVYISGETTSDNKHVLGQVGIVTSPTGWPDITNIIPRNSIVIAKVYPTGSSSISNNEIYSCRNYLAIQSDENTIRLLKSDRENVTVATDPVPVDRVVISKNGERTQVRIMDIKDTQNTFRSMQIDTDKITLIQDESSESITSNKIRSWDDSSTKKHIHFYNAELNAPTNNRRNFAIKNPHGLLASQTRVYKNGLRQELGVDYTLSGSTVMFTNITEIEDTIVVDYDL